MQKKLSVMIPVYNMEKYLHTCFSALIKQKWDQQVEIIVIDDGSTDGSRDICEKYAAVYSYIKFIHKENGGVSSARNMALKYACGEYFYWVDPDDYIADDFWEKVEPILGKGYDLIFFDLVTFSDCYARKHHFTDMSQNVDRDTLVRLFCDGVKMASHLPTKILKKSLWEGISFSENISLCEDYAVLTYIVPKLKNAFYLHESLYKYRQHEGSICHNIGVQDLRNVYKLVNERYIYFTKCGFCVNNTGILLVEYRYLIYIVLRENLSENVENYQEIYAEMLQHLQKNRSVLLSSDVLSKKEKIILYLLIFDVKGIIYVLFRVWKLLKAIWK